MTLKEILKKVAHQIITSRIFACVFLQKIKKIGIVKTRKGKINVRNQSDYIVSLLYSGFYERKEVHLIEQYLNPDFPVIELGASIGMTTVTIGSINPNQIISIEANPLLLPNLIETKEINGLQNVSFINKAIDYEGPTVNFMLDPNNLGSHIGSEQGVQIETITLKEIVSSFKLKEFILISDIEGAEIQFIENEGIELFEKCHQIIIELHTTFYRGKSYTKEQLASLISEKFKFKIVYNDNSVWIFSRT